MAFVLDIAAAPIGTVELAVRVEPVPQPDLGIRRQFHFRGVDLGQMLGPLGGGGILQPDLAWCGGISEARKIAALASAHGVPVIPHAGGLQPWSIHWLAAQATIPWAEYVVVANRADGALRPLYPFLRGVPQPQDGFLTPGEAPGLGVEIDADWLDE